MADTITSHFHWVKPEISGSPTTWGVKLNADLDLIDQLAFDTQTTANAAKALADNIVIGEIKMFAGVTPPANWKLCDGTVYANTDIPLLAPVLNNAFGGVPGTSNAVPDLRSRFPIGYQAGGTLPIGTMGGEATHTLVTAEMPSHTHTPTVTDPQHMHDLNYMFGGGGTTGPFTAGTDGNLYTTGTELSSTGITVANANTGGDGSHNNLPPYVGVNFIIKFQ
jgi:microcystin-dependent protein